MYFAPNAHVLPTSQVPQFNHHCTNSNRCTVAHQSILYFEVSTTVDTSTFSRAALLLFYSVL